MKKNLLFLVPFLVFISTFCIAQEIAMDFDLPDCDGEQHHLFNELDEGKVVIVEFVMLNCSPCIVATQALTSIVNSYEETHPGRVKIYSIGFLDIYKCDAMRAWKKSGSFTHPVFIKGAEQVLYYGGMGMPTFVITGTDTHKVFYKSINGYNQTMDADIKTAIDSALTYSALGIEETIKSNQISVNPSIFSDNFIIKTIDIPDNYQAVIYDITGKKQLSQFISKTGNTTIDGSSLPNGMLILRLESKNGISKGIKLIKH